MRGMDELIKYRNEMWHEQPLDKLENAENYYLRALQQDSSFARVYTGLAWISFIRSNRSGYLSENYLDTVLLLADQALSYDPSLAEAFTLRGIYYARNGQPEKAIENINRALKFNPNSHLAYEMLGIFYQYKDLVKSLECLHRAAVLNRGEGLIPNEAMIARTYGWSLDFIDLSIYHYQQVLDLNRDTCGYYLNLADTYRANGRYSQAIQNAEKCLALNKNHTQGKLSLGWSYMMIDEPEKSYSYFKSHIDELEKSGDYDLQSMHRYGYLLWTNGNREKGLKYFEKQIELCERSISMNREYAQNWLAYYDLGAIYAFTGETEKAVENLKTYVDNASITLQGMVTLFHDDPMFHPIRNDSRFQEIVRRVEDKYRPERDRVRQWLEENEMQ